MTIAGRQRLDKWLWFARVVKSRTLAAKLVTDGFVRVNSTKADAPAKAVGAGDVLTIALERQVRVLKVLAPGARRGPYEEARTLYEDCSPPPATPETTRGFGEREPGAGRPTKKERRSHDALFGDDGFGSGKVD
ncbi:MAG: RNA-binding protein [Rhizobiales bacterium 62-17]|nr:RNA-binding S4 domain-containing protein [Hyphomicrobiales bacterium]OJX99798.1 MAG: RNA-binding protein [Rhizobiales bacterium 62-17]